jgi:hypothetical protein
MVGIENGKKSLDKTQLRLLSHHHHKSPPPSFKLGFALLAKRSQILQTFQKNHFVFYLIIAIEH